MSWTITPQTKVPVDPQFGSVSLLLHGNGTNGSTTITDNSPTPKTVTAVGNAQISTAQSKFGGASIAFDGTGDFCRVSNNSSLNLSSGNFTIECWIYHVARAGTQFVLEKDGRPGSTYSSYTIQINSSGSCTTALGNGAGASPVPTSYAIGTIPLATWTHVAVVKADTVITTYLNGTQGSTATQGTAIVDGGFNLDIGGFDGQAFFNGYIDDLRITKGVARYTANFTPPAAPFPDI
jgi:hypothetical protein